MWLKSFFSSYFSDIYFSISCSSCDLWHHKGWQLLGVRLCMYLVFRTTPNHSHSHPSPKYKISLQRHLNKGSSFLSKEKPDQGQAGYERKGTEGKKGEAGIILLYLFRGKCSLRWFSSPFKLPLSLMFHYINSEASSCPSQLCLCDSNTPENPQGAHWWRDRALL